MSLLRLAWSSLRNRRMSALLCVLTIAASVALLLAVERIRVDVRSSFTRTVSDTDLIVGARGSALQLLLYSVFRIGDSPQNFSWETYQELAAHPALAWSIPLALGDSHRGYRVLATNHSYFDHYRYAGGKALGFTSGQAFADATEAVLGAEVADRLNYSVDDEIILAHGVGAVSFANHRDDPFVVSGILAATGTPVDRTVHIDLSGLAQMHRDWRSGAHIPGSGDHHDHADHPDSVTAVMLRLKQRVQSAALQRQINEYAQEPLTAIQPGVALQQLWSLLRVGEQSLRIVSALMVLAGLLGLTAVMISTLSERRREMAVLRAVGAAPRHVFMLLIAEAAVLALLGMALAVMLFYALLALAAPVAQSSYGLVLSLSWLSVGEAKLLGIVVLAALIAAIIPATAAYRHSLSDGLSMRL